MMSVTNMLNDKSNQQQTETYRRPSVLDISSLLNDNREQQQQEKSPSLSPSLTCSPASVSSSYSSYPFPTQTEHSTWDDSLYYNNKKTKYYNRSNTPISMNDQDIDMLDKSELDSSEVDEEEVEEDDDDNSSTSGSVKAKRRRANSKQLEVLNKVFDRTFFPSTQMRAELGRQLGMSPRTVQIWFQNRRQAMRTRERQRLIRLRNNGEKKSSSTIE